MNNSSRPSVTALLPVKNGENYFNSIKNEIKKTLSANDQIIVINDGSTDNSLKLYNDWGNSDNRVLILNNRVPGLANALNLGIKHANFDWLARFDHDDQYAINRIDLQMELMSESTAAIFSDYTFQSETGSYLGVQPSSIFRDCVSASLVTGSRTPHPVAILNKAAVNFVGGYIQSHFPAEDLSLWLRLNKVGDLKTVPQQLLNYKINKSGITQENRNTQLIIKSRLLNEIGISKKDFDNLQDNLLSIIELYKSTANSDLRTILLINDYLNLGKYLGLKIAHRPRIYKLLLKPKNLLPINSYIYWAVRRKIYRL